MYDMMSSAPEIASTWLPGFVGLVNCPLSRSSVTGFPVIGIWPGNVANRGEPPGEAGLV